MSVAMRIADETVLLDELERVGSPILAARLDHVQMADHQDRPAAFSTAVIAHDDIFLAVVRSVDDDVFLRESRIEQTLGHRVRCGGDVAHRIGRVDFDELLEDIERKLARGIVGRGIARHRGSGKSGTQRNGNAAAQKAHAISPRWKGQD
jgi:hypothetical protein